ncbi:MAG: Gfo/Idh/MocA family oxidoreductase [Cyclobacteriaceae bacterium]|nr:Gfo/Idh/MocA family oxidoreductase [Cyclobacteriaceae bacterium]
MALLSFGLSGKAFHAPFLDVHPGFDLLGSWERSSKKIQTQYLDAKSYSSLESLLKDEKVDLVVVNSPTYTHFDFTKKSILAGKYVIVEKAFTATIAEAIELKRLAEERNLMLSVFQNRRWDSDFKTVQKVIEDGLLGDLVEVSFSFDRYNPILSPKLHKEFPRPGAGIVHDLGPHLIDQALVLFGLPTSVFASMDSTRPDSQVADYFDILLFYPSLKVRLRSGYFVREPLPSYVLHGKKGSFLKTRADVQEVNLQAGQKPGGANWGVEPEVEQGILHTEVDGKIIRERVKTLPGNYMDYYEGIYQAIVNHKTLPVTAEDGVRVMHIIEAAYQSHHEKRIVELD